jgi:hypothetical protein
VILEAGQQAQTATLTRRKNRLGIKAIVQDCAATCITVGEASARFYPNAVLYVAPRQAREYEMLIKFTNLPNHPLGKRRVSYEITTLTGPPEPRSLLLV